MSCKTCGIKGSFFAIERHTNCRNKDEVHTKEVRFRPNLYAVDKKTGEEIMITIDHIVPKSLGGKNNFDNLQPMCEHCNFYKADYVPTGETHGR